MKIEKAKMIIPTAKTNEIQVSQGISMYQENLKSEYYNIEIEKLIPFSKQSRKVYDEEDLNGLADSIKEFGIRQPLTIIPSEEDEAKYEIICGERRWRAAKIANLKRLPCIIINNWDQAEEIAIIENIQRKDLILIELTEALSSLMQTKRYETQEELAKKLGMSRPKVTELISYGDFSDEIKNILIQNGINNRLVYRTLKALKTEEDKNDYLAKVVSNNKVNKLTNTNGDKIVLATLILNQGKIQIKNKKLNVLSIQEKENLLEELKNIIFAK